MPLALQALLPDELARVCNIDVTDARRIVSTVHRTGGLPARSPATIRRAALDAARAAGHVPTIQIETRAASAIDPFVKYAFRLPDGAVIETVRIPLEHPGRFSVCVSSQVGCALACAFCATGRMGLGRNLEAWEIVEQVRRVREELAHDPPTNLAAAGIRPRVHGVLFQGMGEPMANIERVIHAIRVMSEPSALAIDMRNITVCTSGLPTGIRTLLREVPAVRLGVSLGSARPGRRRALMPIEGAHPLEEVLAAAGEHARATGRSPMFAYTLLAGQNDADEDAAALADLCLAFAAAHGQRPRLSLIPYNAIADGTTPDPFQPSTRLEAFRAVLLGRGVGTIVRYSGGGDVGAACGQLARPLERGVRGRSSARPSEAPEH
ncbi:radical SAM protein [Polyangium sorediatum]|uniref:Radical SAM protein n=1 Tax=Polyangium sorediatum TaxID=889274 RepID=A0ABT6NSI6_9BACT|nr:radical SAM protein [Polyangium sorediatum]MDI1431132.1 radical SAM protein [Polyangium sorediatum]